MTDVEDGIRRMLLHPCQWRGTQGKPCKFVHSISSGLSSLGSVGAGHGDAGTHRKKCTAAGIKLLPLGQSSHLRLTQLTSPVDFLALCFLCRMDPKVEGEERGNCCLSPACQPGLGLAHPSKHVPGRRSCWLLSSDICWIPQDSPGKHLPPVLQTQSSQTEWG